MVSGPDADVIERGGTRDFSFGDAHPFPAAKVDRRLKDGDTVTLDTLTLHAHVTPGHTKGCTTWRFEVIDNNRPYDVVDMCGLTVLDTTRLVGNAAYPDIVSDYERAFAGSASCRSTSLSARTRRMHDGTAKAARLKANPSGPNPFIDPEGFWNYIDEGEKRFREALAREKRGG
jgi:metallo-beta-lactamase class B